MMASAYMSSCDKQLVRREQYTLSFNMKGQQYDIIDAISTKVSMACGYMQYNLKAHKDNKYFEINITSDGPLKPNVYIMVGRPTISISGRCTFWYSGPGENYTPFSMRIYVDSFINNKIVGRFEGDNISNGIINVQMPAYHPSNN